MVALALAIAVVTVAYASAAPQLGVAEFAPSARQAVEPPPTSQPAGSALGEGRRGGRSTTSGATTSTTVASTATGAAAAPTTQVARGRTCFGEPPRQIEDPLSPACAATIFEGDNGGATARGVSSTEIRVAVPATSVLSGAARDTVDGLFEYFNSHFELYGRRLRPVYIAGSPTDAVSGRAVAAEIAMNGVFAAITAPLEKTAHVPQAALVNELGRSQVLTISTNVSTWWSDRTAFDPLHPYLWSVYPSSERIQSQLGAVACSMVGDNATFATSATVAAKPRKFAIFAAGAQAAPNVGVLSTAVEACTGQVPTVMPWTPLTDAATLTTGFERMAADGVTSFICVCERWYMNDALQGGAVAVGVDREWLIPNSGYFGSDEYLIGAIRLGGRLRGGTILVGAGPRLVPLQARPWFGALLSTRGSLASSTSTSTGGAYANQGFVIGEPTYAQLLVLASGIQAAGPALTADAFAQGLMSSRFPNPDAGRPPAWQPSVGFAPGDHGFYDDFTIGWWSTQQAPVDPGNGDRFVGSFCYVDQGARFTTASVPRGLSRLLFDTSKPCR